MVKKVKERRENKRENDTKSQNEEEFCSNALQSAVYKLDFHLSGQTAPHKFVLFLLISALNLSVSYIS